ncbi:MAG TPA: metallophosphoesterase family protein [Atribacteraceae bacterium]|nr:metallophosphoesterase family protein [Atribacteraceae bacterium]
MTITVFSDIHGNTPALEAVLSDIASCGVEHLVCLGDLVGYAPFPNEVIARIRSLAIPVVMGNYDQGVGNAVEECGCAYRTQEEKALGLVSIRWTNAAVTLDSRQYLKSLLPRYEMTVGKISLLFVHGSPRRINEYLYPDRPDESLRHVMTGEKAGVLVCGHTHRPFVREVGELLFANDGSVGRPKDGDWRVSWALLDLSDDRLAVEIRRLEYDLASLEAPYRSSGLPMQYFEELHQNLKRQ